MKKRIHFPHTHTHKTQSTGDCYQIKTLHDNINQIEMRLFYEAKKMFPLSNINVITTLVSSLSRHRKGGVHDNLSCREENVIQVYYV